MLEALSLIVFAGVMYFCLVVAPTAIEIVKTHNCTSLKEHIQNE